MLVDCVAKQFDVVPADADRALHGGGLAVASPQGGCPGHHIVGQLTREGRPFGAHGVQRSFFHRASQRLAVGLAVEHAALGVRRCRSDSGSAESGRVAGTEMARTVDDHDRAIGRDRIEFLDRRRALLLQLDRLVSHADDPRVGGHLHRLRLHPGDNVGYVGAAEQVGVHQVLAEVEKVAVRVDEARQQGAAGQIDAPRSGSRGLDRSGQGAHIEDLAVLLHQRFGVARLRPRHGEDVAAAIQGGGGHRQRCRSHRGAGGTDQAQGKTKASGPKARDNKGCQGGLGALGLGIGKGQRQRWSPAGLISLEGEEGPSPQKGYPLRGFQRVGNSRVATKRAPQPWGPLSGPSTQ